MLSFISWKINKLVYEFNQMVHEFNILLESHEYIIDDLKINSQVLDGVNINPTKLNNVVGKYWHEERKFDRSEIDEMNARWFINIFRHSLTNYKTIYKKIDELPISSQEKNNLDEQMYTKLKQIVMEMLNVFPQTENYYTLNAEIAAGGRLKIDIPKSSVIFELGKQISDRKEREIKRRPTSQQSGFHRRSQLPTRPAAPTGPKTTLTYAEDQSRNRAIATVKRLSQEGKDLNVPNIMMDQLKKILDENNNLWFDPEFKTWLLANQPNWINIINRGATEPAEKGTPILRPRREEFIFPTWRKFLQEAMDRYF